MSATPSYNLKAVPLHSVKNLFVSHHAYGGSGSFGTYVFAVIESGNPIAAFIWNPPPPGASRHVCPEAPHAVLALSRMVAVPKNQRKLKHISKPLRRQMKHLIDRGRWPVLITFSDEGLGHNGFVYQCSGWTPTHRRKAPQYERGGARTSTYANGKTTTSGLTKIGNSFIQRWENWICAPGTVQEHMSDSGWIRIPIPGKVWKSGNQAYRWTNKGTQLDLI